MVVRARRTMSWCMAWNENLNEKKNCANSTCFVVDDDDDVDMITNYRIRFYYLFVVSAQFDCNFRFYLLFAVFAHLISLEINLRLIGFFEWRTKWFPHIVLRALNLLTEQFVLAAQKSLLFDFIGSEWAKRGPIYIGVDEILHSLASICVQITKMQFLSTVFLSTGKLWADRRWCLRIAMMNHKNCIRFELRGTMPTMPTTPTMGIICRKTRKKSFSCTNKMSNSIWHRCIHKRTKSTAIEFPSSSGCLFLLSKFELHLLFSFPIYAVP